MSTRTDLPLQTDPATRFLPWIMGLLIYLASLSMMVGLTVNTLTAQWIHGLGDVLILEIPPFEIKTDDDQDPGTELKILQMIQSTPGLGSFKTVPLKDALSSMGHLSLTEEDTQFLPKLLEIRVTNRQVLNLANLKNNLATLSPHIHIEDHSETRNLVYEIAQSTKTISFVVVSLIVLATISIIAFTSQTSLIIHRNVIEILYLVGATRSYIGKQFQSYALRIGTKASFISLILGALTLLGFSFGSAHLLFIEKFIKFPLMIGVFSVTAFFITFFIMISARLSVRISLQKSD